MYSPVASLIPAFLAPLSPRFEEFFTILILASSSANFLIISKVLSSEQSSTHIISILLYVCRIKLLMHFSIYFSQLYEHTITEILSDMLSPFQQKRNVCNHPHQSIISSFKIILKHPSISKLLSYFTRPFLQKLPL